jgi:hypothetical protein
MYVTVAPRPLAAAVALGLALAACGGDEVTGPNEPRFPADKRAVAHAIDRLQAAARDGDASAICEDVVTEALARRLGRCAAVVEAELVADDARLTVESIRVRRRVAHARVRERNGNVSRVRLRRVGDAWRIDAIQAQPGRSRRR